MLKVIATAWINGPLQLTTMMTKLIFCNQYKSKYHDFAYAVIIGKTLRTCISKSHVMTPVNQPAFLQLISYNITLLKVMCCFSTRVLA